MPGSGGVAGTVRRRWTVDTGRRDAREKRPIRDHVSDTLVEEFGADEDDTTLGYSLPWLPVGYLGAQLGLDVERAAFNTPVGRASEPILGEDGNYYVIYVKGHEVRELSQDLLAQAENQAYEGWLAQAKDERAEYLDWEDAVISD